MPFAPTTKKRIVIALAVVSAVVTALFCVRAYDLWQQGSQNAPSAPEAAPDSSFRAGAPPSLTPTPSAAAIGGTGAAALSKALSTGDPFAGSQGSNRAHDVTVTITSDGAAYNGYKFRDGHEGGPQVTDKRLVLSRTVKGPLPLVLVAVQVMANATYATCSIAIDGVEVMSRTARGVYDVVLCLG